MAENTKVYAPIKAEAKKGVYGEFFALSFKAEKLLEFIKAHTNEAGFVNLTMSGRKEVGKYGETHSVTLDTWKPSTAAKPF